jgi:transposase
LAVRRIPSFVTEIPLVTTSEDLAVLTARLEAGRQLYNAVLSEGKTRLDLVRNSELYQEAKTIPRAEKKARSTAFSKAKEAYRFTDYDLQSFANQTAIASDWIKSHLDANTIQKIATRAFKSLERVGFGKAKKVRFKQKGSFTSLEGKTNKQGIRWTGDCVEWSGLKLQAIINNDPVILHGLNSKVKYVRLVRRVINRKIYWFAQLVCEGVPYQKPSNIINNGIVGIDLGVSTVAIVGDRKTIWTPFVPELASKQKKIRRLQRKMDRQRRAGNPDNFNSNGTVKKGSQRVGRVPRLEATGVSKRWYRSHRYQKTAAKKREVDRKQAAHRKSLHGQLVNRTLTFGKNIKSEKVSVQGWQKIFGSSIGFKAPSSFQSHLCRKAESAGGTVLMFSTRKTALSQTCLCGNKQKKSLSQRIHHCSICGLKMQRDILSAYLSRYVDPKTETLSIQSARDGWLGMEQSLLDGWQCGSKQSASTATSSKSPTPRSGIEWMSSNPIAREESEPRRVYETHVVSWNPPDLSVG